MTTVYKNTGLRAQLAKRLAIVFSQPDLSVCSGAGMPLVNQVDCTEIPPPWTDLARHFLRLFFRQRGKKVENKYDFIVGMHDPMTVIYTLAPHLFEIKSAEIFVETSGDYTRGVTVDSMNVFLGTPTGQNCHLVVKADQSAIAARHVRTVLG